MTLGLSSLRAVAAAEEFSLQTFGRVCVVCENGEENSHKLICDLNTAGERKYIKGMKERHNHPRKNHNLSSEECARHEENYVNKRIENLELQK